MLTVEKKTKVYLIQCANCGEVKFCRANGLCLPCAKKLAELEESST